MQKAHKKVKQSKVRVEELERELARRNGGVNGATGGDKSSVEEEGGDEVDEEGVGNGVLEDLTEMELKTQLGQARHALKKAQDDVTYVTFFPVKEYRYISLYPKNPVLDLKLRTQIRRQILTEHTYEEACKPEISKKKWEERKEFMEKKSKVARDASEVFQSKAKLNRESGDAEEPKMNRKQRRAAAAAAAAKVQYGKPDQDSDGENEDFFFESKEAADSAAETTRARASAKIAEHEAQQKRDSAERRESKAIQEQEKRRKEGLPPSASKHDSSSSSTKHPSSSTAKTGDSSADSDSDEFIDHSNPAHRHKLPPSSESKNDPFFAPEDDTIPASDFFGDDYRATGRLADEAWEAQQERAQRTGDRKFRFLPSAPEYLTSRGKKRVRDAPPLPSDGFTKKPWQQDKEMEANSDRPHGFHSGRGRPSLRGAGRGGFRGGAGFRGGGRGGFRGGFNSRDSHTHHHNHNDASTNSAASSSSHHSSSFGASKPSFEPSKPSFKSAGGAPQDPTAKKKRSRPKSKRE